MPVRIAHFHVGAGRTFVIAEAGVNHNGQPELAFALVDAAVAAGADAVKFQTFRAERLASPRAPKADYQRQDGDASETQLEMLTRLELSASMHRDLMDYCRDRGILFLSTPFDEESADLLVELGVPAIKVPSGELTNLPFLGHLARSGRPLIVSTGMSTVDDVDAAADVLGRGAAVPFVLLHCVSSYPALPAEVNLRAIQTLEERFHVPVGYSDHTGGIDVALAAVALGACVIEKHITLDRRLPGPDHKVSIEPDELSALVRGIRSVEAALGDGKKKPAPSEHAVAAVARKSLVAARDLAPGEVLTADAIVIQRPGTGLSPARREEVIGRTLRVAVLRGVPLTAEMLA